MPLPSSLLQNLPGCVCVLFQAAAQRVCIIDSRFRANSSRAKADIITMKSSVKRKRKNLFTLHKCKGQLQIYVSHALHWTFESQPFLKHLEKYNKGFKFINDIRDYVEFFQTCCAVSWCGLALYDTKKQCNSGTNRPQEQDGSTYQNDVKASFFLRTFFGCQIVAAWH